MDKEIIAAISGALARRARAVGGYPNSKCARMMPERIFLRLSDVEVHAPAKRECIIKLPFVIVPKCKLEFVVIPTSARTRLQKSAGFIAPLERFSRPL